MKCVQQYPPAIYKFAPTLVIGLFLLKVIGQNTTCYLAIGSKKTPLHWPAYAIFDPIYIKA